MTIIEIREATLLDAEGIAAHIKTANTPDQIRQQVSDFASNRQREGLWLHLIAVDDGKVVGNIAIIPTRFYPIGQRHRAELADVVVAQDHRGTGLLGRLVDAAAERAREAGVSQLETAAWLSNPRAVQAYKKIGFAEWGRLPNAVRGKDGNMETLVLYLKDIS